MSYMAIMKYLVTSLSKKNRKYKSSLKLYDRRKKGHLKPSLIIIYFLTRLRLQGTREAFLHPDLASQFQYVKEK